MTLAVVLGGAAGVWEELARARRLAEPDCVVAVNHAGRDYPGRVDHMCSYHVTLLPRWIDDRRAAGRAPPGTIWTARILGRCIALRRLGLPVQEIAAHGGSSGLLGALVAARVADKAILCGVPMDAESEHYDKTGAWTACRVHRPAWLQRAPELKGRVKSMGGWTAKLLGMPDAEWVSDCKGRLDEQADAEA